ncbi:maleylacetoacetate isomerase [Pseudoalteromonas fenneropenaei]|uniref:Maleylacetoacetate isomerase n=1 Tax=Pseudoalteromonas fenneropenaei TaxID=1737459 RepID=A0ABV7CQ42_9GAMM
MRLYSYFRSSAAYRVRIALNLKNIAHELVGVNLLKSEQMSDSYLAKNPQGLLPALETEQGVLAQSLAILEWLEETQPQHPLLPHDSWQKAQVRSFCYAIACDIHPIDNLRVLKRLVSQFDANEEQKNEWYRHWIIEGFKKLEPQLGQSRYCFGNTPTLADVCLVPQVFNALRFNVDMTQFPRIAAIYAACNELEAFRLAAPEHQPDAV